MTQHPSTPTTIAERAERSFANTPSTEYAAAYVDQVLQNFRDTMAHLRRTVFFGAVLVLAFALIANSPATEITFGPVKLSDSQSALALLPAMIAFLFYEALLLQAASNLYFHVVSEVLRVAQPDVWASNLELALAPPTPSTWGDDPWREIRTTGSPRSPLMSTLPQFVGAAWTLGVIGFLAYSYYWLFDHLGWKSIATWASLVFAALYVARGIDVLTDGGPE